MAYPRKRKDLVRTSKANRDRPARSRRASPVKIGLKLRQMRKLKRLRLKDLADQIGLSESLLSKVENDKASPSASTLKKLVDALGVKIEYLFAVDDNIAGPIARKAERPVINSAMYGRGEGIRMERLIPYSGEHLLQANIHIIASGGYTYGPIQHGGEEMGLILSGELELTLGKRTYALKAGDSFHFRSELSHSYRNPGPKVTRVIWVNTPPAHYLQPISNKTKPSSTRAL